MIIAAIVWLPTAGLVALFVGRASGWQGAGPPSRTRVLGARERDQVVRSGVDAVVALAAVRALFPPPGWASWLWVVAAVAVGLGVAGLILRWRTWPASRRPWVTVVHGLVGAGLVILLA